MRAIESVVFLSEHEPDAERGSVLVEFDLADHGAPTEPRRRYSIYVVTPGYLTELIESLRERESVALGKTSPIVVVRRISDTTVKAAIEDLLPRIDQLAKRIDAAAGQ